MEQEVDLPAEQGSMIVEAKLAPARQADCPRDLVYAESYAEQIERLREKLIKGFRNWKQKGLSVAIYGAGIHTRGILECLGPARSCVKLIYDDDPAKTGRKLHGISIEPLEQQNCKGIDLIVVSSLASEKNILERLERSENFPESIGFYRDILGYGC